MSLGQSELTEFQTAINGQDHLQRERERVSFGGAGEQSSSKDISLMLICLLPNLHSGNEITRNQRETRCSAFLMHIHECILTHRFTYIYQHV